jgi:hypothetical protein
VIGAVPRVEMLTMRSVSLDDRLPGLVTRVRPLEGAYALVEKIVAEVKARKAADS